MRSPKQLDALMQINIPQTNAKGNIYVADRGNRRIQVFDSEGSLLRMITIDLSFDERARPAR